MGGTIPRGSPRWLIVLLATALLLASASAYGNRRLLLSKLRANDGMCTLSRLEFPPVGPQVFLPAEGDVDRVLQTVVSNHTVLTGIEIGLLPLPNTPRVSGTLVLRDAGGAVVRRARFDEPGFGGGVLRVSFEPVTHPRNARFSFSLAVDAAAAGLVAAQGSNTTAYSEGSLFVDGARQPFSLFHRTVHPTRWQVRNLVAVLEFVKLPYFIVIAIAGLLAYRFLSYRAIYLVVLLASIYTVFAFMPFSKTDEEAHFDYVNQLSADHRLPLIGQTYSTDELDALAGEIGNLEWSSYLWFGKAYVAVHPPLYYTLGAALAALAGTVTGSMAARFFLLRLLGVLCLVASAALIAKTYELLIARSVLARNDLLICATVALFLLSPGFQSILIPVTNEQLAVALMSLHFYQLARLWLQERPAPRDLLLLSATTGLLLLTKTSALHIVPLVVVFLLAKRVYAGTAGYLAGALLFVLPWLVFNLSHYGALQGVDENLGIMSRSLDKSFSLNLRTFVSLSDRFVQNFLLSYDRTFPFSQKGGLAVLLSAAWKGTVLLLTLAYCGVLLERWARFMRGRPAPALAADVAWGGFCLLGIGLHFLMLAVASWRYSINLFDPRYVYMDVLAAVFSMFVMSRRLGAKARDFWRARRLGGI